MPLTLPEHTQVQLVLKEEFDIWAELDEINQHNPVEIEKLMVYLIDTNIR